MKLSSLIQPEFILCNGKASSYDDAKEKLIALVESETGASASTIMDAVREREEIASTIVAPGIGFPHARTDSIGDFYVVVGAFPEGVPVDGQDVPLRFIVMYLLPEGASNLYLRCMSSMAKVLFPKGNLDRLVNATDAASLLGVIDSTGVMVKDEVTAADIMSKDVVSCNISSTLRDVADIMVKYNTSSVPVVDDDNKYIGMVSAHNLLKVGLPEYLLAMDSVDFLRSFEPFQDLLKQEQSMTAASVLDRDAPTFINHAPMIVVASKIVRDRLGNSAVIDDDGRLVGMVSGLDFVHKVVRA
ncbi:MAG: PTS sugar transporter subunit IIA [Planctomycetes bacterium]|nr:PTS sugar transporter subunit IIA [Planctomycetota bacterium]